MKSKALETAPRNEIGAVESESIAQTGARIVTMLREIRADTRAMHVELHAILRRMTRDIDARAARYNRLLEQYRRAARLGRPLAKAVKRTRPEPGRAIQPL